MKTFNKSERLYEKKLIAQVFNDGKSFYIAPFKIIYLPVPFVSNFPVKALIAVPIKYFKKATDRNLIKRRTREAYRKNKDQLYKVFINNDKWVVGLIYTEKNIYTYKEIEEKIILILQRLAKEYKKNEQGFNHTD